MSVAALIGLSLRLSILFPAPADAASFAVDRSDDDPTATACTAAANDCSLRGAIMAANALPMEAIDIAVPAGTYALRQPTPCTYRTLPPWCQYVGCTFTTLRSRSV